MVNRRTRIVLIAALGLSGIAMLLAIAHSMVACLLGLLLLYTLFDYFRRRDHNRARSLNAALRSVCYQQGAITRIASAFSHSGPLSRPCHDFTRRLLNGEAPIDAAVLSGVPLQLRTAIALENPNLSHDWQQDQEAADLELVRVDSTTIPIYGQFIYLAGTATITLLVIFFMSFSIVPMLESIMNDFGLAMPFESLRNLLPYLQNTILLLVALTVVVSLAIRIKGMQLPTWVPMLPRRAERKAELLLGLADGYDAGFPVDRMLGIAHAVSQTKADRRSLNRVLLNTQTGSEPIESLRSYGWLTPREAAAVTRTDPARTARLLRTIADQNLRDSTANLSWLMAIFYPIMIALMGLTVAVTVIGFFGSLIGLTIGIS